jgi:hypothetical protein
VFGLVDFVSDYRPYFGVVFLLSLALLLGAAIVAAWERMQQKREGSGQLREMQERLHHLSKPEKRILRGYIEGKTRTQNFSLADGVVGGLVAEHIVFRASNISSSYDYFAYNIQPWAWEYLSEHRQLLDPEG